MDDWPQIKERLEKLAEILYPWHDDTNDTTAADIRAALQRVEETTALYPQVDSENDSLRQRVEELESSDRESIEMYRRCRERAEAAETRVEELEEMLRAENERFSKLCCVCEGDCCRLAKERLAEVKRLEGLILDWCTTLDIPDLLAEGRRIRGE